MLFPAKFYAALFAVMFSIVQPWSASAEEERWALLIGNQNYTALPSLRNPINDIRGLAERLNDFGFHVVTHENLVDDREMSGAILDFAHDAKEAGADAVLVHYAGHGFEIGGENYLVPTKIEQVSEAEIAKRLTEQTADRPLNDQEWLSQLGHMRLEHVRGQSLQLDQLLSLIEGAASTRIMILDACRNLPEMRSTNAPQTASIPNTGFAISKGSQGTMIIYSTEPGKLASDGDGPVSPFMQAMLDHIDTRGIGIHELMTRVRKDVIASTRGEQVPWDHSALVDTFSFRPVPDGFFGNEMIAEEEPEPEDQLELAAANAEAESELWGKIAGSFETEAYVDFLQRFPDGVHAEDAKERLTRLANLYGIDISTIEPAAGEPVQIASNDRNSRQVDMGSAASGPKRIVIVGHNDFVADRQPDIGSQWVGLPDMLVDRIAANLAQSPQFEVLERAQLRRVVNDQRIGDERFERKHGETYLRKTFDESFGDVRPNGGDVVIIPDGNPSEGGGIVAGAGLGTVAAVADYQDLLDDFKDVGSSVGADYLVFGRLETIAHEARKRRIPYAERVLVDETMSAGLRLRVVDVKTAKIVAAIALEAEVEADVFERRPSRANSTMFEALAQDVTGAIADAFSPATVIKTEPLVVDRGAIHGVGIDDTFTIERPGSNELFSKDGTKIGDYKSEVAKARVIRTDATWSEIEIIEGQPPAQHDIARLDRDAMTTPFARDNASGERQKSTPLRPGGEAPAGRPKLVVMPVYFTKAVSHSGIVADGHVEDLKETFAKNIATSLHQSRRFQMLERYDIDSFFDEADLAEFAGNRALPEEFLELERPDHLVMAEISLIAFEKGRPRQWGASDDADDKAEADNDENADRLGGLAKDFRVGRGRAHLEGMIRIADGHTGAWVEARRISITIPLENDTDSARIVAELAKEFAARAGVELITSVFPLKVASVTPNGTVYINRGLDGGLEIGEVLTAFRQGAEVVDPDTGISLGREETMIGQVTLTRVDDFSSIGTLADLNQPLAKNDRLRRQNWNRNKTSGGSRISGLGSTGAPGEEDEDDNVADGQHVIAIRRIDVSQDQNVSKSLSRMAPTFGQELANKLRATRRFAVLERSAISDVIDEIKFNSFIEGATDFPDALKAVDYVVLTRLDTLSVKTESEHNPLLDETTDINKAVISLQVRLVDVRSSEQVAAETIRLERELNANTDQRLLVGDMLALAADEAVRQIMASTFPMEIIGSARQGRWYVNRGADGGLSVGDDLMIYHLGEELRDGSGLSYGRAESEVGRAVVVQVDTARSLVELQEVSGDVAVGDILRPFKERPMPIGSAPAAAPKVNTPKW